jgi:hypothetical protein
VAHPSQQYREGWVAFVFAVAFVVAVAFALAVAFLACDPRRGSAFAFFIAIPEGDLLLVFYRHSPRSRLLSGPQTNS